MNCTNWLRNFIGAETMPSKYVSASAKAAGFTKSELKQARKELGIKTEHRYIGDQKEEAWYWTLPTNAEIPVSERGMTQGARHERIGH